MTRRQYIEALCEHLKRTMTQERDAFVPGLDLPMTMADFGLLSLASGAFARMQPITRDNA